MDIAYLRECMRDFPDTVIGVCYLGNREKESTIPLADWIRKSAPQLVENMPFILEIAADKERVLGDGYGDLFCFVPKDDNTTLGVNHITWESNGAGVWPISGEVLYRNEYAKPVLVFSNYEEFWDKSNVMVTAYAGDGSNVVWCPCRNPETNEIDLFFDICEDKYAGMYQSRLIMDFTSFGDVTDPNSLASWKQWDQWDYIQWLDPYDFMDDGWSPVYDTTLMNTKWERGDKWYMSLGQGNCDPAYAGCAEIYERSGEGQAYKLMYSGVWRMEGNYLHLETSSTTGTGTFGGNFLILVSPSGEEMDMFEEESTFIRSWLSDEDNMPYMSLVYRYE